MRLLRFCARVQQQLQAEIGGQVLGGCAAAGRLTGASSVDSRRFQASEHAGEQAGKWTTARSGPSGKGSYAILHAKPDASPLDLEC